MLTRPVLGTTSKVSKKRRGEGLRTSPDIMYVVDGDTGKIVSHKDKQLTDLLCNARKTKKPWEVVDLVVEAWAKLEPTSYKSYVIKMKDIKETRKKTRVGTKTFLGVSRDDKKNGAITSYVLDIPEWVVFCLRKLYNSKELIMDKEFFRDFGKRYPMFKVRDIV